MVHRPVVMGLFAHPDDETLACGATLALLADRGWDVTVVIVTDGLVTVRPEASDNRDDAVDACRALGVEPPTLLGFPDQRLDTVAVADLVNAARHAVPAPDLVLTHAAAELNRDHQIVNHVAKVLARPIDRPIALVECEVPGAAGWNAEAWMPNWYCDVGAALERKLKALACYRGERRVHPHPSSQESVAALARQRGAESGLGLAEAFRVLRGHRDALP